MHLPPYTDHPTLLAENHLDSPLSKVGRVVRLVAGRQRRHYTSMESTAYANLSVRGYTAHIVLLQVKLSTIIFISVKLEPRGVLQIPGIYHRLRRQNDCLQTMEEFFGRVGFPHPLTPKQTAKSSITHHSYIIFVSIYITINNGRDRRE